MKLRLMATALLFNGDDLLMMKRSMTRVLHPGMWAAVGGHFEPGEIADPRIACLREVMEETGIAAPAIADFRLQYILLRQKGNEIRQQFFYVGRTLTREVALTEEGELHWVPRRQTLDRELPYVFRGLLGHYMANGDQPWVWVGTAGVSEDSFEPVIRWCAMSDPNVV